MKNKNIAIIQRDIPDYRVEFCNKLDNLLQKKNIKLTVFAGNAPKSDKFKDGLMDVNCGKRVKNYYFFNKKFYLQNLFTELNNYDLVIVEQANSALLNFFLLFRRYFFRKNPKIAYWGHGKTLHRKSGFLSNKIKKNLSNKSDYWFGYTENTRKTLNDIGIPNSKICIVNNSTNTDNIKKERLSHKNQIKDKQFSTIIFCSRLYKNKKIPFIIEGCTIARKKIHNIKLIIIGDGPEKNNIRKLIADKPWIEMTGSLYGKEKSKALLKGDIMVLPSHVGLSILDGFAAGLPIIISDFKNHCPEIAYFKNNINGVKTANNLDDFSNHIIRLFKNPTKIHEMSLNAIEAANQYTVKDMSLRFSEGIIKAVNR